MPAGRTDRPLPPSLLSFLFSNRISLTDRLTDWVSYELRAALSVRSLPKRTLQSRYAPVTSHRRMVERSAVRTRFPRVAAATADCSGEVGRSGDLCKRGDKGELSVCLPAVRPGERARERLRLRFSLASGMRSALTAGRRAFVRPSVASSVRLLFWLLSVQSCVNSLLTIKCSMIYGLQS